MKSQNTVKFFAAATIALASVSASAKQDNGKAHTDMKKTDIMEMTVDTAASKVSWSATKKVGAGHNGDISLKSGKISMTGGKIVGGELTVNMKSLAVADIPKEDENNKKLHDHLSSPDFFDVAKFDTASLKIKKVKQVSPTKIEIAGDLTIKGVTQPVMIPADVSMEGEMATATGKLTIDRTKFGVKYGSANYFKLAADKIVNDPFDLEFKVSAKK
jgi:polyisoprenoid-binding protein YceI